MLRGQQPLHLAIDEYKSMGWALYANGKLVIFRLSNGELIEEQQLTAGKGITAASFSVGGGDIALGFDDGTAQFGSIGFATTFLPKQEIPVALSGLAVGEEAMLEHGIVQKAPQLQFRLQEIVTQLKPPVKLSAAAIQLIDHVPFDLNEDNFGVCTAYTREKELLYCIVREFAEAEANLVYPCLRKENPCCGFAVERWPFAFF